MTPAISKAIFVALVIGWYLIRYKYARRSRRQRVISSARGPLETALLLPNWIAGFAGLAGFGILFFGRVAREERMMLETFGDSYRAYMERTGRIFPSIL